MSDSPKPKWTHQVLAAGLVVLLVAVGARVVWELLAPLLPLLLMALGLWVVYSVAAGKSHR